MMIIIIQFSEELLLRAASRCEATEAKAESSFTVSDSAL